MSIRKFPAWVTDNYLEYVNLLEPVKQKLGTLDYADEEIVIVSLDPEMIFLGLNKNIELISAMRKITHPHFLSINGNVPQNFSEQYHYRFEDKYFNYAYFNSEPLPLTLPAEYRIRHLELQDLEYVYAHYPLIQDKEYLSDTIKRGMIGIEYEGTLCGFIGRHDEGAMGLLFIDSTQRRKGLGYFLEASLINDLLEKGILPYCQVEEKNLASKALQTKLGLTCSKNKVTFFGA